MTRFALAPGSLPWLLLWELRIRLRGQLLGRSRLRALLLYGGFVLVMHAIAGLVLRQMFRSPNAVPAAQVERLNGLMLLTLLFFMLMAASLSGFRLVFAGRELTPQLTSPVPFARVLWVRVLGLVATAWSVSILLVAPVANMGALLGRPGFLLAYPVTVALAAMTVAVVLLLTGLVVRLFGVLRARRVLQLLQAVLPLAFVLFSVLGRDRGATRGVAVDGGGLEAWSGLMAIPARALAGDVPALLLLAVLAATALLASVRLARYGVLASLQLPDTTPRRQPAAVGALRFRTGLFRVLLLKEWRTILRDPRIAASLLVQPLLVVPAFYSGLLQGRFRLAGAVAMAAFVASQMSQYVANLMISAEEAPSLLGAAPRSRQQLIAMKCAAALAPILGVLLLAAGWIASQDLWSGLVCLACCLGAAFCACAIEISRPYPSPRRSFVQLGTARRKRDPLDILSILMMQIGWTGGAFFLAERNLWGAAIVFGVILVPFLEWWRDANRQALLGY